MKTTDQLFIRRLRMRRGFWLLAMLIVAAQTALLIAVTVSGLFEGRAGVLPVLIVGEVIVTMAVLGFLWVILNRSLTRSGGCSERSTSDE